MKELNFCVICALAVLMCFLLEKLNRIEKLLRGGPGAGEKNKTPAAEPVKNVPPAAVREKAEISVPLPVPEPEKTVPAKTIPAGPSRYDEMWKKFCFWFCYGIRREDVSREYAAATTWLIRAGIAVLLCAVGFFLKYSIENNLVSPAVRIALTFSSAAGMFVAGLAGLNKRFHVLAVGILSVGIVTFYMGAFAGFRLYHLLPAGAAFAVMVLTTCVSMLTAVKFDLLPVALIGCAGGYLTPVMLADKSGDLRFLLAYVVLISAGILVSSRSRVWRVLEWTAFLAGFILIGAGFARLADKADFFCVGCVAANFLVFSLIGVIRPRTAVYGVTEWLLPILSCGLALVIGVAMIHHAARDLDKGLVSAGFAVMLAAVTMGEGLYLARKRPGGEKLLSAFLSGSIVSLAAALPLALERQEAISSGWSVLAAVLIFAYCRSRLRTLLVLGELAFTAAFFVMAASADPDDLFTGSPVQRFFLGGVFSCALLCAGFMLRRHPVDNVGKQAEKLFFGVGGLSLLVCTSVEVFRALEKSALLRDFRHGGLSVWWAVAAVGLLVFGIRRDLRALRISGILLFAVCLGKIYLVDISGLNTLHKVAAFLLTGILFLGGATAYVVYRKRFAGEEK